MRPAFRYFGGKWRIAEWIISYFPPHTNYVEPCGGAASVLLQKPRSPLETYNDLDGHVVNFFRVLRDHQDELIRQIRLTPWSREEFDYCRTPSEDPIENARRFYLSAMMAHSRGPFDPTTGARFLNDVRKHYSSISVRIDDESTVHLFDIAKRLNGVQIENRDYRRVIEQYDNDAALIYFDPPYVMDTRTGKGYRYEFDDTGHREAAGILNNCAGAVVISGYACPLYSELYESEGWQRHDLETMTNGGTKKTESVWLSPKTTDLLQREEITTMPLFETGGRPQ